MDPTAQRRIGIEWAKRGGEQSDPDGLMDLLQFLVKWRQMLDHGGVPQPIGPHCARLAATL
jgi:hypothetical protein